MTHTIKEDGFHNHFSMIPHLIDDLPLRMGAVRLYLRYKRLVGEAAKRPDWVSNELGALVLAKKLGYESKHMIVSYRRELVAFGLIRMSGDGSNTATEILDIWGRNNSATPDPMIANPPDSGAWITPSQRRTTAKQKDKRPSHENVTSHINEQIIVTGHSGENSGINRKNLEEPLEISAVAPKNPKATKKVVNPRSAHPAIVAFRDVTSRYPAIELYDEVIRVCGESPDVDRMRSCWMDWLKVSSNRANMTWMLDWYARGCNGNPDTKTPKTISTQTEPALVQMSDGTWAKSYNP